MASLDIENTFTYARAKAAEGHVVVIRPDGKALLLRPQSKESVAPQAIAAVEGLLSPSSKRNVAVISDTTWGLDAKPTIQKANDAIPFFGLLMGVASIGHAVWVFGAASDLTAACRDADVLIVDGACLTVLPTDWHSSAARVMRNPEIVIHDRANYKLRRA
jgi:hypothetical protein